MDKIVFLKLANMGIKLQYLRKKFENQDNEEILKEVVSVLRGGLGDKDMVPLSDMKSVFYKVECYFFDEGNELKIKECTKEDDIFIYSSSQILFFEIFNQDTDKTSDFR